MPSVISEGEYSLFYFNNIYSHALLKKPASKDFRVQEEFGAEHTSISPEKLLLRSAEKVLCQIPSATLYARLDFVRNNNEFLLMEAELIEPALYFNMSQGSAQRFAQQFVDYYQFNKK